MSKEQFINEGYIQKDYGLIMWPNNMIQGRLRTTKNVVRYQSVKEGNNRTKKIIDT